MEEIQTGNDKKYCKFDRQFNKKLLEKKKWNNRNKFRLKRIKCT